MPAVLLVALPIGEVAGGLGWVVAARPLLIAPAVAGWLSLSAATRESGAGSPTRP